MTGLVGVAALGVALATQAQFPGGRTDLQVTGQADVTTRKVEVNGDQEAQGMCGVTMRTSGSVVQRRSLRAGRRVENDVRLGTVETTLATDPLAVVTLVIVAIEGETVAVEAEGLTLGVIAALQTGERVVITAVTAGDDGT